MKPGERTISHDLCLRAQAGGRRAHASGARHWLPRPSGSTLRRRGRRLQRRLSSADAVVVLSLPRPSSAAAARSRPVAPPPGSRDCGLRDPVLGPVRAEAARDCAAPRVPVSDPGRAVPRSPSGAGLSCCAAASAGPDKEGRPAGCWACRRYGGAQGSRSRCCFAFYEAQPGNTGLRRKPGLWVASRPSPLKRQVALLLLLLMNFLAVVPGCYFSALQSRLYARCCLWSFLKALVSFVLKPF